ncbi:glucose 1-dehydrogenase [Saccharopolyspora mangrovi]|uniref:Glucose 1-dehydrogenase n=1 Tax=Saccharopolyspora mangrovi TaxID=3082379 RepID=A0ABU6AGI8_9PSEU|nr:glucose 1-dehydrogenase [Saccharopolyspora sp. S2-29]MEB3370626.1 glucose 1-dehydrogenase [Saccharopolyspora sp. S2-29]
MGRLAGKVALVTGAARGQGAAIARGFVAEGASVVIGDILDAPGKELADELGESASYVHLDVSDEHDWTAAVDRATERFGRLDVLVNNAGVLMFSALEDTSLADYERIVRVNQFGTFLGMRAATPALTSAGGGSIVNFSSVEGIGGMPQLVAYTASKFAIRGMTKAAATELGPRNIRVNSVHPGMFDTGMTRQFTGEGTDLTPIGEMVPLGRIGQPEDIVGLVVFLASEESTYCTGAEFVADGGATATHAYYRR